MSKATRNRRRVVRRESRTPLDSFVQRLQLCGADESMVADVEHNWDVWTEDWTPEIRREWLAKNDVELRAAIASVRREWDEVTVPDSERAARQAEQAASLAHAEALGRMGQSVRALLEWVGDDLVRARAVLDLERGDDAAQRRTLMGPLAEMLGDDGA